MSKRLNQEREKKIQPKRMQTAVDALEKLGIEIVFKDETTIKFLFKGWPVTFFPYSGWHTGRDIKDGRGLQNLLNQLKS